MTSKNRIVLDSSAWLHLLQGTSVGAKVGDSVLLRGQPDVITPAVVVGEVLSRLFRAGAPPRKFVGILARHSVVQALDQDLAEFGASLYAQLRPTRHRLSLVDALVLAHARRSGADCWTTDRDFEGLESVHLIA